ncbi:hypothetical protein [Brevibacillus sp. AY1]|nr:hypothetical protein [Brevibacillus sp. AY1]MDH4619985.1 hypothetical protein [Brevibacillus sp. AY1]
MIDCISLPSSIAVPLSDIDMSKHFNTFSFTGFIDEKQLIAGMPVLRRS